MKIGLQVTVGTTPTRAIWINDKGVTFHAVKVAMIVKPVRTFGIVKLKLLSQCRDNTGTLTCRVNVLHRGEHSCVSPVTCRQDMRTLKVGVLFS